MTPDLFINGEFLSTKNKQKILNPCTQEPIAEASLASESEVELAVSSARACFDNGGWPDLPLEKREKLLLKVSQGILDKAEALAKLESLNTGKPIKETTFMDIPSSARSFEYMARNLKAFLEDRTIDVQPDASCRLLRQPTGVVALIVPWNYPLLIASWKLASSLAAGNAVVLKPSSLTPLTALELGRIFKEAGFPKGAVNIINARGEEAGACICENEKIDMISFTGSNEVGRRIISNSARRVKKTIMELGGKSASIVFKDADIDTAVNSSLASIFLNQGQMCTAMSRIFVEDDIYDSFEQCFCAKAGRIKLGNSLDHETQMGPLISERQRKRVMGFVERAKEQGAAIACGGGIPQAQDLQKGFFFEPTVITGVKPVMEIFREEVFGPVACLGKFSTADEAINLANDSQFALAACVWTKDDALAQDTARRINAGTVWINTYGMFYNEAPYGGFKQSGFGKELGREGFLEYTALKNVVVDKTPDSKPLVNFWYGF